MNFSILSLRRLLAEMGKSKTQSFLSYFICSKEPDAESYLRNSSIDFEISGISRTYLALEKDNSGKIIIKGYFTLAVKCLKLDEKRSEKIPENVRPLLNENKGIAQAYLLGQLAKTDNVSSGFGKEMIEYALKIFEKSYEMIGCRVVRLDCKDALRSYYEDCGFTHIGKLDNELNQM